MLHYSGLTGSKHEQVFFQDFWHFRHINWRELRKIFLDSIKLITVWKKNSQGPSVVNCFLQEASSQKSDRVPNTCY